MTRKLEAEEVEAEDTGRKILKPLKGAKVGKSGIDLARFSEI
jgi:hypothetical protein